MRISTLLNKLSTQYGAGMGEEETTDLVSKTNDWYTALTAGYKNLNKVRLQAMEYNQLNAEAIATEQIKPKPVPEFTKKDKMASYLESVVTRHITALLYVPITSMFQWILSGGLFTPPVDKEAVDPDLEMFKLMKMYTQNSNRK